MEAKFVLFTVIALYSVSVTNGQQPCVYTEPEEKKECFYARNLDLTVMPNNLEVLLPAYASYETMFTWMDPEIYCDNIMEYRDALDCAMNVSRRCFDPDGTIGGIPDIETLYAGLQRLCELKDQVDVPCYKTFFHTAADCATYKFAKLNINTFRATTKELTCLQSDLVYDCFEVLTKPLCGENSTNIYLEQMAEYQLSPFCRNGSHPTRERERYFAELNPPVAEPLVGNTADHAIATALTTITTIVLSTTGAGALTGLFY